MHSTPSTIRAGLAVAAAEAPEAALPAPTRAPAGPAGVAGPLAAGPPRRGAGAPPAAGSLAAGCCSMPPLLSAGSGPAFFLRIRVYFHSCREGAAEGAWLQECLECADAWQHLQVPPKRRSGAGCLTQALKHVQRT